MFVVSLVQGCLDSSRRRKRDSFVLLGVQINAFDLDSQPRAFVLLSAVALVSSSRSFGCWL